MRIHQLDNSQEKRPSIASSFLLLPYAHYLGNIKVQRETTAPDRTIYRLDSLDLGGSSIRSHVMMSYGRKGIPPQSGINDMGGPAKNA